MLLFDVCLINQISVTIFNVIKQKIVSVFFVMLNNWFLQHFLFINEFLMVKAEICNNAAPFDCVIFGFICLSMAIPILV